MKSIADRIIEPANAQINHGNKSGFMLIIKSLGLCKNRSIGMKKNTMKEMASDSEIIAGIFKFFITKQL
jgi:hypothetical protein